MWNRLLQVLVESCVYMDPHAYMFYIATKRNAAGRARSEQDRPMTRSTCAWSSGSSPGAEAKDG